MASSEASPPKPDELLDKASTYFSNSAQACKVVLVQLTPLEPSALQQLHNSGLGMATVVWENGARTHTPYLTGEPSAVTYALLNIWDQEARGERKPGSANKLMDTIVSQCLGFEWKKDCCHECILGRATMAAMLN